MLKIQVLGKGLIPRGLGLAPRMEPFSADLTLIGTIMATPGLKVNMIRPEDGKAITLNSQNMKRMWETYTDAHLRTPKVVVPQTAPVVPVSPVTTPVVPPVVTPSYQNPHNVNASQVGNNNGSQQNNKPASAPQTPVVTQPDEKKDENVQPAVDNKDDKKTDATATDTSKGFVVKPINADDKKNNNTGNSNNNK